MGLSILIRSRIRAVLIGLGLALGACSTSEAQPAAISPTRQSNPPGEYESSLDEATTPAPPQSEATSSREPSQTAALPAPPRRRLRAGELVLAADVDDIPAIFASDGVFVPAAEGNDEWLDDELVIGLIVGDDARAYPVRLLSLHEIVNDTVGGQAVAVTWCPLCFTAIVFERVVDGKEVTFGVSGYLYYNNLVMYDHRTETLWSQIAGEAIRGALRGERLTPFPSVMTSWAEWKAEHPETRVLSAQKLETYVDEVIDPYAGYYTSGSAGVIGWVNPNDVLGPKDLVVGVLAGNETRAYPFRVVQEHWVINDDLGPVPLLLAFDPGLKAVMVYQRRVDGQVLSFTGSGRDGLLGDEQSGSTWEIRTGEAVDGPFAGARLPRLSAPLVFWFAWSDFHSQSDVYTPEGRAE